VTWNEFILLVNGRSIAANTKEKIKYKVMLEKYQPMMPRSTIKSRRTMTGFFI
jgi:hypothetical protein